MIMAIMILENLKSMKASHLKILLIFFVMHNLCPFNLNKVLNNLTFSKIHI